MSTQATARATTTVGPMASVVTLDDQGAREAFSAVVIDIAPAQLAKAARRTKECARQWKTAKRFPCGRSLINMARKLPTVKAWLYEEIERTDEGFASDRALSGSYQKLIEIASRPGKDGDEARKMLRDMAKIAAGDGE